MLLGGIIIIIAGGCCIICGMRMCGIRMEFQLMGGGTAGAAAAAAAGGASEAGRRVLVRCRFCAGGTIFLRY